MQPKETNSGPLSVDADLENADWSKATWDFPNVKTPEQLVELLHNEGMTVDQFMKLPAYQLALKTTPWLSKLKDDA